MRVEGQHIANFLSFLSALHLSLSASAILGADRTAASANHLFSGTAAVAHLGKAVDGGADIDGDGYSDVVVSAPGAFDQGRVFAYSGKTGQLLSTYSNSQFGSMFGWAISSSKNRVLVGDPVDRENYFGKALVFEGLNPQPKWSFTCDSVVNSRCGWSVATHCDLNHDGFDDFIVGAVDGGARGQGKIFAYSGSGGELLWSAQGETSSDQFGDQISCAGDTDADGFDDVVVGAWANDRLGAQSGAAYLYSGKTGLRLRAFYGEQSNANFGWSVAGGGDFDGDGAMDIIVGAPGNASGYAKIFSGKTGVELGSLRGDSSSTNRYGYASAVIGDQNGDSVPEFLISDTGFDHYRGRVYFYSGRNFEILETIDGENSDSVDDNEFGSSIASAGDANRDAGWDFIIGAPQNDQGGVAAGRAYLFYGAVWSPPPPPPPPTEDEDPTIPPEKEPDVCAEVPVCPEPVICPPPPPAVVCPEPVVCPAPVVCPPPPPQPPPPPPHKITWAEVIQFLIEQRKLLKTSDFEHLLNQFKKK